MVQNWKAVRVFRMNFWICIISSVLSVMAKVQTEDYVNQYLSNREKAESFAFRSELVNIEDDGIHFYKKSLPESEDDYIDVIVTAWDKMKNRERQIGLKTYKNGYDYMDGCGPESDHYFALKALDEKYEHLHLRNLWQRELELYKKLDPSEVRSRRNLPIHLIDSSTKHTFKLLVIPSDSKECFYVINHETISPTQPLTVQEVVKLHSEKLNELKAKWNEIVASRVQNYIKIQGSPPPPEWYEEYDPKHLRIIHTVFNKDL